MKYLAQEFKSAVLSAVVLAAVAARGKDEFEMKVALPGGQVAVVTCAQPGGWSFSASAGKAADGTDELAVDLSADAEAAPPQFSVRMEMPQCDTWHRWAAPLEQPGMPPAWKSRVESRLSSGYPFVAFLGGDDTNRLTVAFSEAKRKVSIARAGGEEQGAAVGVKLDFFTEPEAPLSSYSVKLRIDRRAVYFGEAIGDAADWVCRCAGLDLADVPEAAFDPVYSTWYQFHQDIHDADIEAECAIAAKLGMKTLIVDDGWQTDDNSLGYAFCGDWEISTNRFADMPAHVRRVQAMGMKYIVWFAVPFVGEKSKNYERFKGKFVSNANTLGGRTLDPRFPEVRSFIASRLAQAMREWGIDGLKLDFIDYIRFAGADPAVKENYAGRDIKSLAEATDRLMKDIRQAVFAVKPDALIEFRQSYVGPAMRQYGNMFRARDCHGDIIANRSRICNIRLAAGNSAVHADMLLWNTADKPENSARLVISTLFSAVQYSMMLRDLPENHRRMLAHWIGFSQAHREALLKGSFHPRGYDRLYPVIEAESAKERIVAVAADGTVAETGAADKPVWILNGSSQGVLFIDAAKAATAEIYDTFGARAGAARLAPGVQRIEVPRGGYVCIQWRADSED